VEGACFGSVEEALLALVWARWTARRVRVRYSGELLDLTTVYDDQDVLQHRDPGGRAASLISTPWARILFNDHIPEGLPFVNGLLKKKGLAQLVQFSTPLRDQKTVEMADEL